MTDVLVLCYHAVSPTWPAPLAVTQDQLEQQLSCLIRRGWRGSTFTQAVLSPPARRTLVVTFDDAYLSVRQLAEPVLTHLGLPGTVFAPTSFMSSRQPLRWEGVAHWSQTAHAAELTGMDWPELAALAEAGWEVGSHTRSHPHLTELDDAALGEELRGSLEDVAQNTGRACQSIAYPYGAVDERVALHARHAGYLAGASLDLRSGGRHRWPRVGIYRADHDHRFRLKVNLLTRRVRGSRSWPK